MHRFWKFYRAVEAALGERHARTLDPAESGLLSRMFERNPRLSPKDAAAEVIRRRLESRRSKDETSHQGRPSHAGGHAVRGARHPAGRQVRRAS